jgi:para-aminobenzoate synthetase/4-amino-4-deoxychorismate lyase
MKGTAPRGGSPQEDTALAHGLTRSAKERAENVMIVDLLRNDLSRIAQPHSVRVPALFAVQSLPTVHQMVSDVTAQTRPGTPLCEVFAALFPCGSITGAPKVQAMHLIRTLEPAPRGVYCGAIGVVRPGGRATFNVAIRTVTLRGTQARCGIGSGITADASAGAEWQEWRHKRGFLERASEPFALLETLRLENGEYSNLIAHSARLERAARHFGYVFDEAKLNRTLMALAAEVAQTPQATQAWRVRLLLQANGQVNAEKFVLNSTLAPVKLALAATYFEAAHGEFTRFKTTRRAHYEAFSPTDPAVFDTLLYNAHGELTECTRGNIAVLLDGQWLTPALHCGLLPGVGRAACIAQGRLKEAVITVADLPRAQGWAFVNSLRGWVEARLVGSTDRNCRT